jgi:TIR domain
MATDKVFISYAHADANLAMPLRQALTRWSVDFWFDDSNAQVGHVLLDELLTAIHPCDILIRLCTSETPKSVWMQRELGMWLAFQREKSLQSPGHQGKVISICFDGYEPDDLDRRYLYIDAANLPSAAWVDRVRMALNKSMRTVKFVNDEASYLWWVAQYTDGYVLATEVVPKVRYLMLHRAFCTYVTNTNRYPPGAFTEQGYIKICALNRDELEAWARDVIGETATPTTGCNCMTHGTPQ